MKKMNRCPVITMLLVFLLGLPFTALGLQKLNEQELANISGQDGATFVFVNFDFYITSPGVEYLDVHFDADYPLSETPVQETDGYFENDENRSSVFFQDLTIHDGSDGSVVTSGVLDFDGYTQVIDGVSYTFGKLDLQEPDLTMDLDVGNIGIRPAGYNTADFGGISVKGLTIDSAAFYFGAADDNTGLAAELNLRAYIRSLDIDMLNLPNRSYSINGDPSHVVLENIMIAGYFDPVPETITDIDHGIVHSLEKDYDSTIPSPYASTPGLWSEDRAWEYAEGNLDYYYELINANRYKPNWKNWEFSDIAHGTLKIGDAENGNPLRMDYAVDTEEYIPFPYDIICGEAAVDGRAEWYEPVTGDFNVDARGWKDGKDNYIQDRTNYQRVKNPRYNKAYMSIDAHISGSIRMVSDNEDPVNGYSNNYNGEHYGYTDIVMIEGIDLQVHAEIPGYGYGNTPNSIPRPYPNPNVTGPRYDAPFGTGGTGNPNGTADTYWPEAAYSAP